jgi:hypothetical protein
MTHPSVYARTQPDKIAYQMAPLVLRNAPLRASRRTIDTLA